MSPRQSTLEGAIREGGKWKCMAAPGTCQQQFSNRADCKVHLSKVHGVGALPVYRCHECPNKEFADKSNFSRHMAKHKDAGTHQGARGAVLQCPFCESKIAGRSDNFVRHLKSVHKASAAEAQELSKTAVAHGSPAHEQGNAPARVASPSEAEAEAEVRPEPQPQPQLQPQHPYQEVQPQHPYREVQSLADEEVPSHPYREVGLDTELPPLGNESDGWLNAISDEEFAAMLAPVHGWNMTESPPPEMRCIDPRLVNPFY